MTTRTLITGATGFIGSHLAELLLAEDHEVVCLVRDPNRLRHVAGKPLRAVDMTVLKAEMTEGPGFNYVFHLAGATRGLNYDAYYQANVELTRRLLELCAAQPIAAGFKRFVLVSSQAAVGPSPPDGSAVTESTPCSPVSLYGKSKLESELVADAFMSRLPITILRPPTVFGPRDVDVLGVFRCAGFRIAPCLAGPNRLVSVIYVEDLVRGMLKAAFAERSRNETYFLTDPEPVIWREFALNAAQVMGYRAVAVPIPLTFMRIAALVGDAVGRTTGSPQLFRTEKLEEMKQIAWVCSPRKALEHLSWKADTPLDVAMRKTADWYRAEGWI